ncbi:hypothetical protein Pla110_28720 [Polystyrenella longa]|uniref:DUF1963 domain-containing protein n=1 Tax=Polystyrenella longa TaxID=2528007 RepID=A0A518CPI5_9PLAN|nr:DUF1963 domain-containing protein [Polystyrenella longa]QDU81135.1 hypothetical protein Pla110_28720 [Polystyrenella longa]
MHNYTFELEEWLKWLPLEMFIRRGRFSGEIITGPCDICNNEQLRKVLNDQYRWGSGFPSDIFIWADGEPKDRHVTKTGGLPYLVAGEEWPADADGAPLLFIGQVNFGDSKDLTGELPGDILLVFADQKEPGYFEDLRFEWRNYTAEKLITLFEIPTHQYEFKPTYGYRCRVLNFPDAERLFDSNYPLYDGHEVWSDFVLLKYQGTQIGIAPFGIQPIDTENPPPGRMLCVLSSIQPTSEIQYPWVNQSRAIPLSVDSWDDYLMISDMGCLYIYIDDEGALHWSEDSY